MELASHSCKAMDECQSLPATFLFLSLSLLSLESHPADYRHDKKTTRLHVDIDVYVIIAAAIVEK